MPSAQKPNKKRVAASQGGPNPKKIHLDQNAKSSGKKRSQPVTAPIRKAASSDSDSDDDLEAVEDVGEDDNDDWVDEDTEMVVDEPSANQIPSNPKEPGGTEKILHRHLTLFSSYLPPIRQPSEKHTRLKKFCKNNVVQRNPIPHSSPTPNRSGRLCGRKTSPPPNAKNMCKI